MKKRFILLLLLLFLAGCKFGIEQQNGTVIKDVIINELEGGNHSISFNIKNFNDFSVDCYARILLGNRTALCSVGVIKARNEEKKQTIINLKNGKTQIKVEPVCKEISDSVIQKCGDLKGYTDRRICELELENPELKQCSMEKSNQMKLFCIALTLNNFQICQYMLTPKRHWCAAYISEDYSLCEKIIDLKEKDWCYMDIGMNKKDKDICEKVNDEAKKTSCMGAVLSDADMCLKGDKKNTQACIMNVIESTGDKILCEKLSNSLKEECYSIFG